MWHGNAWGAMQGLFLVGAALHDTQEVNTCQLNGFQDKHSAKDLGMEVSRQAASELPAIRKDFT